MLNTLVAAAAVEAAARVAEWIHPQRSEIDFAYAPYRMLKMTRAPWPLNRDGFRAAELETYRGSFLIEFVGGSVCLGAGASPGPPIPELLETALHRAGCARARVLNLCQGGASSLQELAILLQFGLPLEPQVVISFNGANDLMHPRPVGDDDAPNLPYRDAELRARLAGSAARDLGAHLAMVRVAARLAGRGEHGGGAAVPVEEIVASYVRAIDAARAVTESRKAAYLVAVQPTLHFEKPWSEAEKAQWTRLQPRRGAEISTRVRELFTAARPAITAWGAEKKVRVFDLTRVFQATTAQIYSDSVHFNGDQGYRMLFAELERLGLIEQIAERYRDWAGAS